jgi:hypothetical protein
VIETFDRAEVNWSALKITFSGETPTAGSQAGPQNYVAAERLAKEQGLTALAETFMELRKTCGDHPGIDPERHATDAAKRIASTAQITNTTYFSDGRVKLNLESSLAKGLLPVRGNFAEDAAPDTEAKNTGLVFRVQGDAKPVAIYRVVDNRGNELFSSAHVTRRAYYRNLMGKWLKAPSSNELAATVGENPASLSLRAKDVGVFEVSGDEWAKVTSGNELLLRQAAIALELK